MTIRYYNIVFNDGFKVAISKRLDKKELVSLVKKHGKYKIKYGFDLKIRVW